MPGEQPCDVVFMKVLIDDVRPTTVPAACPGLRSASGALASAEERPMLRSAAVTFQPARGSDQPRRFRP